MFENFGEVVERQSFGEYWPVILSTIVFWTIVQVFFEVYGTRFSKTVQEKPRDAQIEHRSYLTSLMHSAIVVPIAFYSMFYAW